MSKLRFDLGRETFTDLQLRHDATTNALVFETHPLERLLERNGLPAGSLGQLRTEGLEEVVLSWYLYHVSTGGRCSVAESDAVMKLRSEENTVRLVVRRSPHRQQAKRPGVGRPLAFLAVRLRQSLGWLSDVGAPQHARTGMMRTRR